MGRQILFYSALWVTNYQMLRTTGLEDLVQPASFLKQGNYLRTHILIVHKNYWPASPVLTLVLHQLLQVIFPTLGTICIFGGKNSFLQRNKSSI